MGSKKQLRLIYPKMRKAYLRLGHPCIGDRNSQVRRIPHSPNSLNSMHWAVKAKWKEAWENEVYYAWLQWKARVKKELTPADYKNYIDFFPLHKAKVNISVFTTRPQDADNAIASMKGVIDGLTKSGLILDDKYEVMRLEPITVVPVATRDVEHVEIRVCTIV